MKLNLIPKTAAKGAASKTMFIVALAAVIFSLVAAFMYNQSLQTTLQSWKDDTAQMKVSADEVVRATKEADEIVAKAQIVLTNKALYDQIVASNTAYPDTYDEVKEYIPSFFRVRTFSAQSTGERTSTMTISGYLRSFQQYSDVMIALLRCPSVVQIGRNGFGPVPAGDEGPFGYNPEVSDRGAIPGWSAVTITLQLNRDLRAPDPRATLAAAGSAPAPGQGGPGGRTGAPAGSVPSAGGRGGPMMGPGG
jgi:hypothetical protein